MQFISTGETYPAVYLASGRSVVPIKLLAKTMKTLLSEPFRFV